MSLIIPGVQISVIRELVPKPLGGTGILGIVGCTENDRSRDPLKALASAQEFREYFGRASTMAMPEVRQAFSAGLNQVVVANIPPDKGAAASAQVDVKVNDAAAKLEIRARANGAWGNKIAVRVISQLSATGDYTVEVHVCYPTAEKVMEKHRNLTAAQGTERYWIDVLNVESDLIKARLAVDPAAKVVPDNNDLNATPAALTGGEDPPVEAYSAALTKLEYFGDVDMVTASHSYGETESTTISAEILSHCVRMSKVARPRIGFGQTIATDNGTPDIATTTRMASRLVSERFVFVAPHGYLGATIGMIAGLRYFDSPTYKTLLGANPLVFDFSDPDLEALIKAGVCAIDDIPRKGTACVKGITTDQDQINVTRIADRAVRMVQNIAQDFIGLLNTPEQRSALKARISEAFTRMEKEGALVPSVDGLSPAYTVVVECTPDDFAAGNVRVFTAVRPVRAIDYIYATIKVLAF